MKTVGLPEDLHKELLILKLEENYKTVAELIKKLIREYKKLKNKKKIKK